MTATQTTGAFRYVEGAYGGARNRNKVLTVEEFEPNGYADCYRSMLRFPKAFEAYVTYNDGSVQGYAGEAKADFFACDFDGEDLAEVLEDARQAVRRWEALYGVPPEALRYFFSGRKGIHIEVPETLFGGLEPGRDTAARLKAVAREMLGESKTADLGIYDTTRLWRAPNTRHKVSGLYKIPLYAPEFFNLTPAKIRELAKQRREGFVYTDPAEFEPVPELVRLWRASTSAVAEERHRERLDTAAVLNGVPRGERDNTLFKLACKLRRADVPQDWAERLLAETAANCEPPFSEKEARAKVANAYGRYAPNAADERHRHRHSYRGSDGDGSGEGAEQVRITSVSLASVEEPDAPEEVLAGMFPKGWPGIVFGAAGAVKSIAAQSLGQAIADPGAEEWLGRVIGTCPVMYADLELNLDAQARRAYQIARGLGADKPPAGMRYMSTFGIPRRQRRDFLKNVLEECVTHEAGVCIIDSLGLAIRGDAGSFEDVVSMFEEDLSAFCGEGVTPLLIGHQRRLQAGERGQSLGVYGSVFHENLARAVVQVELVSRDRENHTVLTRLRPKKANFSELGEPLEVKTTFAADKITLELVGLDDVDRAGEETLTAKERVLAALRALGEAGPDEITEACQTLQRTTVRNVLSKLRDEGSIENTGEMEGRAHKVRIVTVTSPYRGDGDGDGSPPHKNGSGGLWEGAL